MSRSHFSLKHLALFLSTPVITACLAGMPAVRGHAQTVEARIPPTPAAVSNADDISLDVLVRDRKNKPVVDLKPEDLAVTDNGGAVRVSSVRLISGNSASDHLVTLMFAEMDSAGAANARSLATKILKAIPPRGFSLSVMKISGSLTVCQEYSTDRAVLTRAIAQATTTRGDVVKSVAGERNAHPQLPNAGGMPAATEDNPWALSRVTRKAVEESRRVLQEQQMTPSFAGLLGVIRSQARLPGRKVAIFFAQGLNLSSTGREMMATVSRAARRANFIIYSVDVNALDPHAGQSLAAMTAIGNMMSMRASANLASAPQALTAAPPPHANGDVVTPGMQTMIGDQFQRLEMDYKEDTNGPLADLAASTGGAYIGVTQNPQKTIRKMVADMTTYYEVSYPPPVKEYNGEFRNVGMKPVRKGLKLQSSAGYFALPPDDGLGIPRFQAPLLQMLGASKLPDDLRVRSTVLHLGELLGGNTHALVVEVPVAGLEIRDDPNTKLYSYRVSVVAQVKDATGKVLERFSEDVPRRGSLDAKQDAQSQAVTVQRHFTAGPGEYTLEVAALDRYSGKQGAQRSTFTVSNMPTGASLSDLVLVRSTDLVTDDTDAGEPLRYGSKRVIPDLAGEVAAGRESLSLFSLIHLAPRGGVEPRLEITVIKDGEPIAQMPLPLTKVDAAGSVPYVASIHSASLSAGNYRIVETLTQGDRVVEQSRELRIEGPQLAGMTSPNSTQPGGVAGNEVNPVSTLDLSHSNSAVRAGLIITPLPTSVQAPSSQELQSIVEDARKNAVNYSKSLANFLCVEVTSRSVDRSGNGDWKHRDTLAELLSYVDGQEHRSMLEMNGQQTTIERNQLDPSWPISVGEFGGALGLVFDPASKAEFEWKEAVSLGKDTAYVLSYRVAKQNATISLHDGSMQIGAGFHGLVYIDSATKAIRRLTFDADDLPRNFSIHAASVSVDYDYVAIATHDYMMPVRAAIALQRSHRQIDLNEIVFRNYRRFASKSKIIIPK